MPTQLMPIEQILTLLTAAPSRIAAVTADLAPAQLHTRPAPDEWSANEVLAHLRACADVWGNSIRVILAQDRPIIRAVNPRTWITQTDYLEQEFQSSLHAFTMQRTELLAILEPLTPDEWARTATLVGAGKPLERTVLNYADGLARHERPHLKQIEHIVNQMNQ